MSAILGVVHLDGRPVEPGLLEGMVDACAHRGPDGRGTWSEGSVGLGHLMLRVTPEAAAEPQPLFDPEAQLALTADARLDNREDLWRQLGLPGPARGDGEVILAAYRAWGERCVERLLGDFAFAIWDGRRRLLFCARDPMGVKPFYCHSAPGLFAFASEMRPILQLERVPRRLNKERLADYLVNSFGESTSTFYRDIERLPPAHALIVEPQGTGLRRYWSLDAVAPQRLGSDQAYADAFRALFIQAVGCRLRSASPVGSTLSGGLDSSSIACTARRLLDAQGRGPLHTYSAIFPDLPSEDLRRIDERPYVEAVLAQGGYEPHFVRADQLSPLADLDRVLWHEEEAYCAPNLYLHWALYRAASEHGNRVLLDGIDGDTVVSHGLGYLSELAGRGHWRRLLAESRALGRRVGARPRRIVWEFGFRPLVPHAVLRLWRSVGRRQPAWVAAGVNPEFARRLHLGERLDRLERRETSGWTAAADHRAGLLSPLFPYALELADKAAASFHLEPRYPFFDRRLIEFCLGLPAEQKLHQGWTRLVMRRAMEGILPPQVQWRPYKANLSPNFTRRFHEREQPLVERVLADAKELEPFVDLRAVRQACQRFMRHPMQSGREAMTLFGVVTLACWLRRSGVTA
ncbi:MAG: lasso peptide isopeptide bond-forming cyclase [Candidatus Latescibacterota bacterium]